MMRCDTLEGSRADTAGIDHDAISPVRRRLALWLVAGGMFMAVLDATIVNVALPSMRVDLDATVSGLAWIVDAYTLSMAALILAGGILADRWGAKRVYLLGLALFAAASTICGGAATVAWLVAARFVQGAGAALFLPASLAIVRGVFHDREERAKAIATWAGIASVAAAIGPVAGGVLVGGFGWRSVFFVNLPIGLLAFALTAWIVPDRSVQSARTFDWAGQIASIIMLGALCFAAIEFPERGIVSPAVWLAGAIAAGAAMAWFLIERRVRDPMVPLIWFRNPVFVAANLVGCLVYVGYFGMLFVLSLYLHGGYGLDARQTGLALLPVAASLFVGNVIAGRLQGHMSPHALIASSLILAALSVPLAAELLAAHAAWLAIVATLAVFGAGTSASVPPMISVVLEQVPETASGVASGLLNAMRQIGSLLGVAAAGAAVALTPNWSSALWSVTILAAAVYVLAAALAIVWIGQRSVQAKTSTKV
ncbi:major facilitator transporter [Agrobacterium tumefaciens CCNWGS0286]|uniref:MFS transporter n=1 Tax=Agrobacterium tumefaciens TaxID=358 RepID=UPI000233469C|nr:MFS transporter [Agrobacterium tumefaciens]EHH03599.1 major facilitator transporter [Agrobacterium tumefaciens CCNWGS0286]